MFRAAFMEEKETRKKRTLLGDRIFLCVKHLKLLSDVRYENIHESSRGFTNIYIVFVAVFRYVWEPLHQIISYSKGFVPSQSECVVFYVSVNNNMYLPKKFVPPEGHDLIPLHSQTALTLSVNMCLIHPSSGVVLCLPTAWINFDVPGDWLFVPGNS